MKLVEQARGCSLYNLHDQNVKGDSQRFVASTEATRAIVNDPLVYGLRYTNTLSQSCAEVLKLLKATGRFQGTEHTTTVLHILRGGLNFGLREALGHAYGWNAHASAFISAQRVRANPQSEDWVITESSYRKIHLGNRNHIVLGDVVATGTSLEFALNRILTEAKEKGVGIESVTFFTIGGPRSHEILERLSQEHKVSCTTVYLEGVFAVAGPKTPVSIKLTGTDLLRRDSLLAPELLDSQYDSPRYPLERCTIYDAGSRSFDVHDYLEDVLGYWRQVAKLADGGMTFEAYLKERMPELTAGRFSANLRDVARAHIEALETQLAPSPK